MALIDNLVAFWALDEASGNAIDALGTNTLTEVNGSIGAASAPSGTARDLESGSSQYFSHTDNATLSMGDIDFTVQAWIYAETVTDYPVVSQWNQASVGERAWFLGYTPDDGGFLRFKLHSSIGNEHTRAENVLGVISPGVWYCVHGWHDSVNDQTGIAVNAGTAVTGGWSDGVQDVTSDFRIGAMPDDFRYYDGLVWRVGLWKRVLTSGERTVLYNGGLGLSYAGMGGGPATAASPIPHTKPFPYKPGSGGLGLRR